MATSIVRGGECVFARGYGMANLEHAIPISTQTVFHVASVSKQFTAFAVALLAEAGLVDLEASVRRYLPYVPDFGAPLTVRHLIHHTSGLRDQWCLFDLGGQTLDNCLRQQQILQMVARQRDLNFAPGTQHLYSNTGYTLLSEIVRTVSGCSLRDFTSAHVFRPLGMSRTFFCDDVTEVVPGVASCYRKGKADGSWHRVLLNYENVGATSLCTTADDMAKWATHFANPSLVDQALFDRFCQMGMLDDGTPINYGFGLTCRIYAGRPALLHFGGDAAFASVFAYFPQAELGLSVLANHEPPDWDRLIAGVVDLCLNGREPLRDYAPVPIAPDEALLQALAGSYVSEFEPLITLEACSGQLLWRTAGGSARPVVFRVDGTLDLGNAWRTWSYYVPLRDRRGVVIGLEDAASRQRGALTIHHRIEPSRHSSTDLAAIAGEYRSVELDVTYTLEVKDGRLQARSLWSPRPILFTPSAPDRFDSEHFSMSTLLLTREASGRPVGLRVHGTRVRTVAFERVHPEEVAPEIPCSNLCETVNQPTTRANEQERHDAHPAALEEVVVTAQKRIERLIDTPQSVSERTGEGGS